MTESHGEPVGALGTAREEKETQQLHAAGLAWAPSSDLDERHWRETGRSIARAGHTMHWWIGDWLRFGNRRFGERYALTSRITGYDVQTLMNHAYVASHVAVEQRRSEVSWSHYVELAKLGAADQTAWLTRIVAERLSVKDVRVLLRAAANPRGSRSGRENPGNPNPTICPVCGRPMPTSTSV
jgi:hypothetical protein